jgi:predicted nucleotide-binding protein
VEVMSNIQQELETLCTELDEYYSLREEVIVKHEDLTTREAARAWELHDLLADKIGAFKNLISEAAGMPEMEQDAIWIHAMSYSPTALVVSSLDRIVQTTSLARGSIKREIELGKRDAETGELLDKWGTTKSEAPKAFIIHGGETNARNKLQRFLVALGVQPLIIEEEPKEGRSVDQQVEHYSRIADCAILLGTADDKELKDGRLYPRRNDFIEIGRFLEKSPMRIIYLQEEGASFPSVIAEKLRTPFTHENMDEAFTVVARELRAFGLLKAVKP